MGKYFTINEMCVSGSHPELVEVPKAGSYIYTNLQKLISVMDPIREKWGSAIIVTSGYRSDRLNRAVGGSNTSAHRRGLACDFHPKSGNIIGLAIQIAESGIEFDQLILEKTTVNNGIITNCQWLHLGLTEGKPRKQILAWDGKAYKPVRLEVTKKFTLK